MGRIVGIDLGTTNSVVAVIEEGRPTIIPNTEGERLTPSVVAFDPNTHQVVVGTPARRQAITNPRNTFFSVKRFIGRRSGDPAIQHDVELTTCETGTGEDGGISIWMAGEWCQPQEILALILRKLQRSAEVHLREPVTQAVITVPSCFNDCQRQATKDAGRVAGLEVVLRIINESTAACLAYGLHREREQTIAVYHLGGGTFDISILDIGEDVFEVRSTSGDTHLGGDDWDQRIMDCAADKFLMNRGVDLYKDPQALQRLKEACERAKIELSTVMETAIDLPFIATDASSPMHLQLRLTRARLEQLTKDLVERTMEPCGRAIKDACLRPHDIDRIILVGQQTRMPAAQRAVKEFFGKDPCREVDPAEVVALGAAVQAGVLGGGVRDVTLLDVTPFTLSVETLGGVAAPLVERNTTIPTRKSRIFSTASDGQTSVEIEVYQGERPMASDNTPLGRLRLDEIPPAPRGLPQIEVTFDIDANGILNVSAQDKATGRGQSVTIIARSGGPASRELRPYDTKACRDAESLIRRAETVCFDRGYDLPTPVRSVVDSKISALQTALLTGRAENVRYRTSELYEVPLCVEVLDGPNPVKAIGSFAGLFKEEKDKLVRERIWQALVQIGGPSITTAEALRRYSQTEGLAMVTTARTRGRSIKQLAVKSMAAILRCKNSHLRRRAARVLGWIGNEEAVRPLTEALNDQDDAVRREAMQALARFAVESLVAALEDAGVDTQQKAPCQLPPDALWARLLENLNDAQRVQGRPTSGEAM